MVLSAAALYGLLMFLVGLLLGPLRIFRLQPRFGKVRAVLIEGAVLLPLMPWAAGLGIQVFHVPAAPSARLAMGAMAWGFLLVAEYCVGRWLMRLSFRRYLQRWMKPEGWVGLALQIWFALVPVGLLWVR